VGQAPGERQAARRDAEEHDAGAALVALEDLVRDAGEGPSDLGSAEDDRGTGLRVSGQYGARTHLATSFPASLDGS